MVVAIIVLGIVAVGLFGCCVYLNGKMQSKGTEIQNLKAFSEYSEQEKTALKRSAEEKDLQIRGQLAELLEVKAENAKLKERIAIVAEEREQIQKETESRFRLLANEIFSAESQKFKQASETRLDEILKPLKENIHDFRKTILENYTTEAKERHSLQQHLQNLMEMNASIGKEARELTEALKGNSKVQGDWGEMVLESILQKSGLIKGENYFVQETRHEDGSLIKGENDKALRPDVVVALPDKKYIVIDSKVSLTAYVNYVNSDSEDERAAYEKAHVQSVRMHLKELETKKYQDYIGASEESRIDYVLMFIPNEHAYMTAMSSDKNLWMEAYDKRVVIISPAHVISTLRLIAQLWTRDRQTKNAIEIATESGKLYDKFVGFVTDMQNIGSALSKTQAAYDNAFKKLSSGTGNLISRTENLKKLGAKATKILPEAES